MDSQTRVVVACLCVVGFTIGTDFTGALMLVTPVEQEFGADITTTQWVLNAYALTFAMGMVTGGRLADMFGHRRIMLIGLVLFLIASLGCALAPSVGGLIGARAFQGIGSALIFPSLVALAATTVPERQAEIIGLVMGGVTLGNVLGPIVGGTVGALGEWRLFYGANFALALLSILLILWLVPAKQEERAAEKIDFAGIAILGAAIFALLYALDVGADWGWTAASLLGLFAASAILFAAFPALEKRVADPLVPPPMLRNGQFVCALALNGLQIPTAFLLFLYVPQYLNKVLGWPILSACLGTIPLMLSLAVLSVLAGRIYDRVGPRRLLALGYGLCVIGSLVTTQITPQWGYGGLLIPMLLIGIGAGATVGAAGTAAVAAADPSRAGLVGGLSFMVHLVLGAIGVAAGTAILFATGGHAAEPTPALFALGLSRAYWPMVALTLIGLLIALKLDDDRLRNTATATR
jgi:MFS family permease